MVGDGKIMQIIANYLWGVEDKHCPRELPINQNFLKEFIFPCLQRHSEILHLYLDDIPISSSSKFYNSAIIDMQHNDDYYISTWNGYR